MSLSDMEYQCSFCGKPQGQVKRLIAGVADQVYICDQCVALCDQIISEETPAQKKKPGVSAGVIERGINPKMIYKRLEEYVIGQEQAKKTLSVAVYNHYKRIWSNLRHNSIEFQKANILMLGPSGSGKTYLAETLAHILEVPFAITDATTLTEAGYVGEDVENILLRLIQAADFDISLAENGIIYIDEIDKIARKSPNVSITRDVSGEGVQQSLLKIIEGCVANVPPQGGRKHPHQELLQISTHNILFICGGAFEGINEIIEKRAFKDHRRIGFNPNVESFTLSQDRVADEVRSHVNGDDLMEYGFITELIGRLPVVVSLDSLYKDDLVRVLTEPKNAFVKQYQALFSIDGIELVFTDEALEAAAEQAISQKAGARGLRTILEKTLLDVMYELPGTKGIKKCIVEAGAVNGTSPIILETGEGHSVPLHMTPASGQKTA